eukprot:s254_g5.t1
MALPQVQGNAKANTRHETYTAFVRKRPTQYLQGRIENVSLPTLSNNLRISFQTWHDALAKHLDSRLSGLSIHGQRSEYGSTSVKSKTDKKYPRQEPFVRLGRTIPAAWQGKDSELNCWSCKACVTFSHLNLKSISIICQKNGM